MREIFLDLRCDLTEDELKDRALSMTTAMIRRDEVEADKRAAMKAFAEEIGGLEGTMRKMARIVRDRCEFRAVPCAVLFHTPVNATKRVVRKDTGEIVREEAMSSTELQENLFDAEAEREAVEEADSSQLIEIDELFRDAVAIAKGCGHVTTSLLQRRLRIGYGRASGLIDAMERDGIVGSAGDTRPRQHAVLASKPEAQGKEASETKREE